MSAPSGRLTAENPVCSAFGSATVVVCVGTVRGLESGRVVGGSGFTVDSGSWSAVDGETVCTA